jgi:hypothetical protein
VRHFSIVSQAPENQQHKILLILLRLYKFSGNGFQQRTFPFLWVPDLSPYLNYKLLTATAPGDCTAAVH